MSSRQLYRLAQRSIVTAAGGATWEIIGSPSQRVRLKKLSLRQVTAVAGTFGVGRPAAIGVTPTTPVVFEADRLNSEAALVAGAVAWATPPTVPGKFLYRHTCAALIGEGFDLDFGEDGLEIAAGLSVVIWVIATAPVCDVSAIVEE